MVNIGQHGCFRRLEQDMPIQEAVLDRLCRRLDSTKTKQTRLEVDTR